MPSIYRLPQYIHPHRPSSLLILLTSPYPTSFAASRLSDNSSLSWRPFSHTGFFSRTAPSPPPSAAPIHSHHTFSLPVPPSRHATVEEVPDEDDISVLAAHSRAAEWAHNDPEAALNAKMAREAATANSDGPAAPAMPPDHLHNSELPNGKLQEALSVNTASSHRKTGCSFIDPYINPFVRV
ncbi:hypothetical protein C8R44DRAFT_873771 [Mycena epipterygia]|nr:hypothetical protein C8R44DRAFT_873771 [Mycena epipterygia]